MRGAAAPGQSSIGALRSGGHGLDGWTIGRLILAAMISQELKRMPVGDPSQAHTLYHSTKSEPPCPSGFGLVLVVGMAVNGAVESSSNARS